MSDNYDFNNSIEIIRPFVRNGSFPIDSARVFFSYEKAVEYAHNNKSAFPTQLIGVDDKENKVTALYEVTYDPNKQYRYILREAAMGVGGNYFRLKGSVATYEDLPKPPEIILNGDMYLVEDEPAFYVAFVDSLGNVTWKKLSLEINLDLVTKSNDGLMPKELYSTFYNETGKDAIYFSKSDGIPDPNNNSWLNVEHTEKENDTSYSIASIGRVKEIVGSLMQQTGPHISIEVINDTKIDNAANSEIKPKLRIFYYPELGGDLEKATIQRRVNGVILNEPAYDGHPELSVSQDGKQYFDWEENEIQTSAADTNIEYIVTVSYGPSDDGNMTAGTCSESIFFYFYQLIYYGTNLVESTTFLKQETTVSLKYDPSISEEKINKIYIKIPSSAVLYQVIYVPQNDYNAITLFQLTNQSDYNEYKYELGEYTEFYNSGEFIFNIKK